ncbi:spore cortex biosynthesis protein YabQ [Niallia taxi]|uniref:Spore cortex biosynthesis protein YabQ n=1 Tax=Niallia taxi TaxID=2499688 RepID=A0A437K3M5_9BACI|nr:spore cortex biosynthesis protein YabQ [Niallia taxi]MCM3218059.1 spore cortex biosynthesis protein YabQ [Niallia taxi]MDK8643259.1 spore cortex biosynthesis protein YabQ [Niallia taxi]MED4040147.1 spore cortex biosynthesis protein YabQ [Niallia taxi]MED4056151.1 spore cortex biosynthesis protein YabQ [Niallia taxi]MED4120593.1 spore cortex biosynthesis protein YabQ [Niallia taxi]
MTLSTQFMTMLAMVGMGLFFGISLDTYQFFLKRAERKRIIVFFHDLLFWILQGLLMFYVLFLVNQGEIRIYLILALLLGFAAYQALLKSIYLSFLKLIISVSVRFYQLTVKLVVNLIYKPIKTLLLFLVSVVIFLLKGLMALVNGVIRVLRFILKVILLPLKWLLSLIWLILPKKVKLNVDKYSGKLAGYYTMIKKYVKDWIKNRKKQ